MGEFTAKDMFNQLDKKIDKGNDSLHQKMDTFIDKMDQQFVRQDTKDTAQDKRLGVLEQHRAKVNGGIKYTAWAISAIIALIGVGFTVVKIFFA